MSSTLRNVLESNYDVVLVRELIGAYEEAKKSFYLGGHRLSAVEGGRFCEAAFRLLEWKTTGRFTPIGEQLDTERVARQLAALPKSVSKVVRIYLPRALRVVYDIRNSRDAAHLSSGIDPNLQDATLVISVLDWALAEFVRLSERVSADVAQKLVERLVSRKYPVIQTFGAKPKVLRTDLRAGEHVLVLLYHVGEDGASASELGEWVPAPMRTNLRRTLRTLEAKALIHQDVENAVITRAGERAVEMADLLELA